MMQKVAVITGGGRLNGVGACVAKMLATKGYQLVINTLKNKQQAEQVVKECQAINHDTILFMGDLTDVDQCQQLAALVKDKWNRIDVLVNCLGYSKGASYQALDQLSADDFAKMFAVNVTAPYLVVQAFQELLNNTKDSCVINVSSAAGITGKGSSIAYAASKGALNTLTLALAQALSPKVRVNAVCPSFIDSSWWEEKFAGREEQYQTLINNIKQSNLLNKVLTPKDVAQIIVSVMENPCMTGELIRVDCGAHVGKANKID